MAETQLVIRSRFVKIAPDKIRLIGQTIVKQKITEALNRLMFIPKAGARPLILMIKEAINRAKEQNIEPENLLIKTLVVDEGPKIKRRRIIHRGRATSILKRSSHITVVLTDDGNIKSQTTNIKQIANKQKTKLKK